MRNMLLGFFVLSLAFSSCDKSDMQVSGEAIRGNILTSQGKSVVTAPAPTVGGGGGGKGGGGTPAPAPTNLDIYTKQLIGGWNSTLGFAGTPTATKMIVTFIANGTFTILETADNGTGAQSTITGTWQLSIPSNLPLAENAQLTMNSDGEPLLAGLIEFFHPGTFIYSTTVNNLVGPVPQTSFTFQRLP